MRVDLKLASGKVVEWDGTDEINAAERYVDCHRDESVVATRPHTGHGEVHQYGRGSTITQ